MPVQLSYRETKKMKRKDGKAKYRLSTGIIANLYRKADNSVIFSKHTYRKIENVGNGKNS